MPTLDNVLKIDRCPHCNVDHPNFSMRADFETTSSEGRDKKRWRAYACTRCGGVVTASALEIGKQVIKLFPQASVVDDALPDRARSYLQQAIQSIHAPAGAVMLAGSAVDAMLKDKSYTEGSLYTRINKAAKDHLITSDMASWAHEVRLDANEQCHSDTQAELPTEEDARRAAEFARALGQFLFALSARVTRGREEAAQKDT